MSKLAKLESRFSREKCEHAPALRGSHKPQRERIVLDASAKPEHGVKQPMPERKRANRSD